MQYKEYIDIYSRDDPFDKPSRKVTLAGVSFEQVDEMTLRGLITHQKYAPSRHEQVESAFQVSGIKATIRNAIVPAFDEEDWKQAPLWQIHMPHIEILMSDQIGSSVLSAIHGLTFKSFQRS